jgi:hypothetical protein
MNPDFVRAGGFPQPRAAVDEAAVQYLTASGAAMDAGTIWSGPAVPAGAGSSAGTGAETSGVGVSAANVPPCWPRTLPPARIGPR